MDPKMQKGGQLESYLGAEYIQAVFSLGTQKQVSFALLYMYIN